MTQNASSKKIIDLPCTQKTNDDDLAQNHPDNYFRRDFVKYLAIAIPIVNLPLSTGVNATTKPERRPPQAGDRLTYFQKSKRGQIIKLSDLKELDKPLLVVPFDVENNVVKDGSRYNQILLQKLPSELLSAETKKLSDQGVIAYSAICTHAGCPVTGWMADEKNYMCPCHQSVFNPKDSGVVVSGPATRGLPAIGLKIEADEIILTNTFNSWIGFGKRPK